MIIGLLFSAACAEELRMPAPEEVVARVEDRSITAAEVAVAARELVRERRAFGAVGAVGAGEARDRHEEAVARLIEIEILSREARRLGVDRQPDVARTVAARPERARNILASALLREELASGRVVVPAVDEAALRALYARRRAQLVRGASVQVFALELAGEREALEAAGELSRVHPSDLAAMSDLASDFAAEARVWRIDAGSKLEPAVIDAALALEESGAVSAPVKSGPRVVVMKLLSRQAAINVSFERARPMLERALELEGERAAAAELARRAAGAYRVELAREGLRAMSVLAEQALARAN